jgi:hypothetical protein
MKNFQWNINLVYEGEYHVSALPNTITIPNYEYHFSKVEDQLAQMTTFELANQVLSRFTNT